MQAEFGAEEETARIAALAAYDILDTPPEPGFDDIVAVAAELCGTPIALVSLLDRERQWFKARTGLEACETPIGQAVCGHVLRAGTTLVFPDLTTDPRTSDNPLVTDDPKIRFYAGAPLITPGGVAIGTVCVIDVASRPAGLTDGQTRGLEALARQAMAMIEMRRALAARTDVLTQQFRTNAEAQARAAVSEAMMRRLRRQETRSRLAEEAGRIGTFEVDVRTNMMGVSAEFCRIFGVPVAPSYPASQFEALLVEEDSERRSSAETRANASAELDTEYRIRRADDGRVRWISRRAVFVHDESGAVSGMYGAAQDITEAKLAQLRADALLALADGLRNAGSTREVGAAAAEVLARTLDVPRAGYAAIDTAGGSFFIEADWVSGDAVSIAGDHPLTILPATIAALRDGRAVISGDLAAAGDELGEDAAAFMAGGVRACINLPLLVQGELAGCLFVHDAAPRAWSAAEIGFAENLADLTYAAVARTKAEDEQRLLTAELGHRLKNTLATVQAIARQTLRGVTEQGAVKALEQRLQALSAAHEVLLKESWAEARIHAVAARALSTFGLDSRFDILGPDLKLGPRTVLALTLLLHELATNALKYGALSTETGRISLAWRVRRDGDPAIVMDWIERGGPPVSPPAQKNFGSRLIGMGLTGTGGVELRYVPTGLEAEVTAPLSKIVT